MDGQRAPKRMTPRRETIAYLVWCHASPQGWNVTILDVAENIGFTPAEVGSVIRSKGWLGRFRAGKHETDASARLDGWNAAAPDDEMMIGGKIDGEE